MTAYLESDSMAPDPMAQPRHALPLGATPRHPSQLSVDLQLSINARLMERLDALERKVKELEHMIPV